MNQRDFFRCKNGKTLIRHYDSSSYIIKLQLDDIHSINVEIEEPYSDSDVVSRNFGEVEDYLLTLDYPLEISEVYTEMMKLLNFSGEEIQKSKKILISCEQTVNEKQVVRSKFFLICGIPQEFAVLENGETFHVFKNGDWKYISDNGIQISYTEKTENYVFSITGSDNTIDDIYPRIVINRAKYKISRLWKIVK